MHRSQQIRDIFAYALGAGAVLAGVGFAKAPAFAEAPATALPLERPERAEATMARFGEPVEVVRPRGEGMQAAVFEAAPQSLHPEHVAVIEIASLSAEGRRPRWNCVAVEDVAECLGHPVRVPYLSDDEAMVLSVHIARRGLRSGGPD